MAQLKNQEDGARGVPDTGKSNNKGLEEKDCNVNLGQFSVTELVSKATNQQGHVRGKVIVLWNEDDREAVSSYLNLWQDVNHNTLQGLVHRKHSVNTVE